jgi:hypothetical protein
MKTIQFKKKLKQVNPMTVSPLALALSALMLLIPSTSVSQDLMAKPSGALTGRSHMSYTSMHDKISNCDQMSEQRWKLPRKPIKLSRYKFDDPFMSPFKNPRGSSCKSGFEQNIFGRININTKIKPLINGSESDEYGNFSKDRTIAMFWWSVATSHVVYDPKSSSASVVRNRLIEWAKADALSKNINVPWGKKPVRYEVAVLISRIVETVAAFGPELNIEERKVIGPWLDGLVKKLQRSEWGSRQDNKQYLSDYTVALWGVVNGDSKIIPQLARNYKHAIHDLREDGSIVRESVRGGYTLSYQSLAHGLLVKQSALIKNVSGVEIALYAAEDKRSIQTSMQNIMQNLYEPKSQAKKYGRYCPNASKGTVDNPDMNWTKMYLKPVLEYVSYEYPQFKKMTNPNLVKGRSEYHTMGNLKCMYTE